MVCVHCGHDTQVINSRLQKRSNRVWRRRRCNNCSAAFTTLESADYGAVWAVKGKNGHISPFSRDKLFLSLYHSCRHRSEALGEASNLADTVIRKLSAVVHDGSIAATDIYQLVQTALDHFDMAAGVYYAAYHRDT